MSTHEFTPSSSSSSSSSDSINFNMNQINETLESLTLDNPLIPQNKIIEPAGFAELKANYIRSHLQAKKAEYCKVRELTVSSVTWNVNGREPVEAMSFVIPKNITPDVIVVGLQEIDRRAEAYLSNINLREHLWTDSISSMINESAEQYVKIASRALVGLYIIVFIRDIHVEYVSNVSSASASCGIMGLVGNKGAVGLRFKLYNDYICVVNCHLAAHKNQVLRRNQDLIDLHRRLIFYPSKTRGDLGKIEFLSDTYVMQSYFNVDDAEFVVWLGDFNYRVELPSVTVRDLIEQHDLESALKFDQMKLQKELGHEHLSRYQEAEIVFAPSYSFNTGTDSYDTSEKMRVPSWCDRVLWRDGDPVRSILYDCVFEIKSSDHKPVRQCSIFSVNEIVPEKYEACYLESIKQLDIFENAAIPVTEVTCHTIDVGELRYRQSRPESFSIANKGVVMAQFSFIYPEGFTTPSWIRISPTQGLIGPNETQEIDVLFIYDNAVANLNEENNNNKLDHILVVHIEGGRDHFIAVSFQARHTSFGKYLSDLYEYNLFKVLLIIDPALSLVNSIQYSWTGSSRNFCSKSQQSCGGPRVLTDKIQNSLDLNEPFSDDISSNFGHHSIAETILRFFEALPDSLIPSKLFKKCIEASKNKNSIIQILNEIPEVNFLVFEYFIRFIRDILLPVNTTISKVAISAVLAPILVRKPNRATLSGKESKDLTNFFVLLL